MDNQVGIEGLVLAANMPASAFLPYPGLQTRVNVAVV